MTLLARLFGRVMHGAGSRIGWAQETGDEKGGNVRVPEMGQAYELEGVYRDGVIDLGAKIDLPFGSAVRVTVRPAGVETRAAVSTTNLSRAALPLKLLSALSAATRALNWGWLLFGTTLGVYLLSRLWGLERFPIYFFTDEAAGPLFAQSLLDKGFRDARGSLLPVYFEQAPQRWMPLLSVYFHLPGVLLFGKTILVTRLTSVFVGLLGVIAAALLLRIVFKSGLWWAVVLVLATTPAWYLHSRTAFETVIMVSFYSCFLLSYLLYRTLSPRYIFAALASGGIAFYAYSNGQAIMGILALALLVSDFGFHLKHWRLLLAATPIWVLIILPLVGFRVTQPEAMQEHLRVIGSYWMDSSPVSAKLLRFGQTYLFGLSPQYWFLPNNHDLSRHLMKGMGHVHIAALPFAAAGALVCLNRFRRPEYRTVLLAALAVPAGAATVDVGITRVLALVIPIGILTTIGLDLLVQRLSGRVSLSIFQAATFCVLSAAALMITQLSLSEGPTWYRDYGLYGMQYGAKQVLADAIPRVLASDDSTRVMVSPNWANGTDKFLAFFLSPSQRGRVQTLNVDHYLSERRSLTQTHLLVMTPDEYRQAASSPKLKTVSAEEVIPWPDGRPGFYLARIAYADALDSILAMEKEQRRQLVEGTATVGGERLTLRHSQLDMGEIKNLFDGDRFTLARGRDANPFILEIAFPSPREVSGISAVFGSMDLSITVSLYPDDGGTPSSYSEEYRGVPADPAIEMDFPQPEERISRIRVEIKNLNAGDSANIHIREFSTR